MNLKSILLLRSISQNFKEDLKTERNKQQITHDTSINLAVFSEETLYQKKLP